MHCLIYIFSMEIFKGDNHCKNNQNSNTFCEDCLTSGFLWFFFIAKVFMVFYAVTVAVAVAVAVVCFVRLGIDLILVGRK